jgi:cell division protein FtsQ
MGEAVKARRTRSSPARRLRPFWIVLVAGCGAAAVAVGFAASWPGFDPRTIIVSGNHGVSRDEIVYRAAISPRINMWLQDPRAIARRIETIPDVASVRVQRLPPATIELSVTERKPFAVVRWGGGNAVVDRDLRVLSQPASDAGLPVMAVPLPGASPGAFLHQPPVLALRNDYDALVAAGVIAQELEFDRFGGLVAALRGGTRVLLGDDADLDKKAALINPILAQIQRAGRRVSALDLRAPGTPVVVYK